MAIVKQDILYAVEIETGYTSQSDVSGLGLSAGNIRFITGRSDSSSAFVYDISAGGTSIYNNFTTQDINSWWGSYGGYMQTFELSDSTKLLNTINVGQQSYDLFSYGINGTLVGGDFSLEYGVKIGDVTSGTPIEPSVYLRNSLTASNRIAQVSWADGILIMDNDIGGPLSAISDSYFDWAALKELKIKITRTSNNIKIYYYNSGWIDTNYNYTYSGDIYSCVITMRYLQNGYTYFDFSADYGFPLNLVSVGDIFNEGFLTKNGMSNPSRQIDISKTGNYGDLSNFSFKVNNSNKYWNLLTSAGNANLTQDINLINKNIKVYTVLDGVFYRIWTGTITELSRNEKEFIINCSDESIKLHKNIPREIIENKIIPVSLGDNEYVKLENISDDESEFDLFGDKSLSTVYTISYDTDVNEKFQFSTILSTDQTLSGNELKDKYIKVINGGDETNQISDKILVKINKSGFTQGTPGTDPDIVTCYTKDWFEVSEPIYIWYNHSLGYYEVSGLPESTFRQYGSRENTLYIKVIDPYVSFAYNISGTDLLSDSIYKYNDDLQIFETIPGEIYNNDDGTIQIVAPNSTTEGTVEFYSPLDFTLNSFSVKKFNNNQPYYYTDSMSATNPAKWDNYIFISATSTLSAVLDKDQTTFYEFEISAVDFGGISGVSPYEIWLEYDFTLNSDVKSIDNIFALPDLSFIARDSSNNIRDISRGSITYACYPYDIEENIIDFNSYDYVIGSSHVFKDSNALNLNTDRNLTTSELNISGTDFKTSVCFNLPEELYDTILHDGSERFIPEATPNIRRYALQTGECNKDFIFYGSSEAYLKDILKINNISKTFFDNNINNRYKMMVRVFIYAPSSGITKVRLHQFNVFYNNNASLDNNVWVKAGGITDTDSVYGTFKYILEQSDGISTSSIDYGNLESQRGPNTNWEAGRQINSRQNSKNYLRELCEQSYVALFPDRFGKRKFNCYLTSSSEVDYFDENVIIRDSIKTFKASPIKDVYNEFIVDYNYNAATDEAKKHINITKTDEDSFPTISGDWTSYVTNVVSYNDAKRLWDNAHLGYVLTNSVVTNPKNLQELKWYHNDEGSSFLFLDSLIQWTSVQHYKINFSIPLTPAYIERELTDKVLFNDVLLTNNTDYVGYIDSIEYDVNKNAINISIIADQGLYNPTDGLFIIETGDATTIITESGSQETIYQEGNQL